MVALAPDRTGTRVKWERAIWVIDMAAYLLVSVAGGYAAFDPSDYIYEVVQNPVVILMWGALLIGGGGFAFVGRLTRIWAIEYFANVWAAAGALLYAVILIPAVLTGNGVGVCALVLVAYGLMLRRYAELKIFTNEPGLDSFRSRLDAALKRRTKDVVPREHF